MMTDPLKAAHDFPAEIPSAWFVRRQSNLDVMWALSALSLVLALAYPIVALPYACLLLINGPAYTPQRARRLLAVSMFMSFSILMSLRPYGGRSDDMIVYYSIYQSLLDGDNSQLLVFAGGVEIGTPLVFWLCAHLLPDLTPNGLMLVMTLLSSVLFFGWVEHVFYRRGRTDPGPLLMGVALLLFNVAYSTQLVRQFLSMVILLYSFSATTRWRSFGFLCLAISFHVSALPFFLAYLAGRRGVLGIIAIVVAVLGVRFFFRPLLDVLDVLPPILSDKLAFYVDNNAEYTDADIGSFKLLAQLCLISAISFVWSGLRLPKVTRRWHLVPWLTSVVHVALLTIPLASLRTTLMVHSVAAGVIAQRMIHPRQKVLMQLVFNTVLFYKMRGFLSLEGAPATLSTLEVVLQAIRAHG